MIGQGLNHMISDMLGEEKSPWGQDFLVFPVLPIVRCLGLLPWCPSIVPNVFMPIQLPATLPPSNPTLLGSTFLFYFLFHSLHHVSPSLGISHCPQENIAPQIEHDSPGVL